MVKKVTAVCLAMILLCGCSHKTEVRDKGFVRIIGCDSGEELYAAVRLYGEEDTISGKGSTIFSAVEDAETTQGKTLFTGHLETLVLNQGNIKDTLSVMIKNNRISPSCALLLTPESAADTVQKGDENTIPDALKSNSRKGKISKKNISAVLNDLLEEDCAAAVPVISKGKLTMCITDGERITGILSEEESEGYCWLNDKLQDIYLPISINEKNASFLVRNSRPRITASADGDNIIITAEIKINGSCIEEGISKNDAAKAAAEKVSSLCSKIISKTVTGLNADVLGIKKCIDSSSIIPETSWKDIIPRLQFYYSIKISS